MTEVNQGNKIICQQIAPDSPRWICGSEKQVAQKLRLFKKAAQGLCRICRYYTMELNLVKNQ